MKLTHTQIAYPKKFKFLIIIDSVNAYKPSHKSHISKKYAYFAIT